MVCLQNKDSVGFNGIFSFPSRVDLRGIVSGQSVRLGVPEGYHIEVQYRFAYLAYGFYAKDLNNPLMAVSLTFSDTECGDIASDSFFVDPSVLNRLKFCINNNTTKNNDIFQQMKQPEYLNFDSSAHKVDKVSISSESKFIISYVDRSSGDYKGSLLLDTAQSVGILPRNIEFGYKSSETSNMLFFKSQNVTLLQKGLSTIVMGPEYPQVEVDYNQLAKEDEGLFISFYNPATKDTKKPIQYKEIGKTQDWFDLNYGDKNKTFYETMDYYNMRMNSIQKLDLIDSSHLPDKGQKLEVVTDKASGDDEIQIVNTNSLLGNVTLVNTNLKSDNEVLKQYLKLLEGDILVSYRVYADRFSFSFFKCLFATKKQFRCTFQFSKDVIELTLMRNQIEIIRHGDYFLIVGIKYKAESSQVSYIIVPIEDPTKKVLPLKPSIFEDNLKVNTKFNFKKNKFGIKLYFILTSTELLIVDISSIPKNLSSGEEIRNFTKINNRYTYIPFSKKYCPIAININEFVSDEVDNILSIISNCIGVFNDLIDIRKSIQQYVAFVFESDNELKVSKLYIDISKYFKDSVVDTVCHFNTKSLILFNKVDSEGEVGSFVEFGKDAKFNSDKMEEKDLNLYSLNMKSIGEVETLIESGCLERGLGAYVRTRTKKGEHKLVLINNLKKENLFKGQRLLGVIDLQNGKEDTAQLSLKVRGNKIMGLVIYGSGTTAKIVFFNFNFLKNSYFVKTSKNKRIQKYSYKIKDDDKQVLSGSLRITRPELKNLLYLRKLKKVPPKLEMNKLIKFEEFVQIAGPYYGSRIRGGLSSKVNFKDRLSPLPINIFQKPDYLYYESNYHLKVVNNDYYKIHHIPTNYGINFALMSGFVGVKIAKNIGNFQNIFLVSLKHDTDGSFIQLQDYQLVSTNKIVAGNSQIETSKIIFWEFSPFLIQKKDGGYKLIIMLLTRTQAFKYEATISDELKIISKKMSLAFDNIFNIKGFYIQNSTIKAEYYGESFKVESYKRVKVGEEQIQVRKTVNYQEEGLYLISNDAVYSSNHNLGDIKRIREIPSDFEVLEMISSYGKGYEGYIARKITLDSSELDRHFVLIYKSDQQHTHFIQEFKFNDLYYGMQTGLEVMGYSGLMGIDNTNVLQSSNKVQFLTKVYTEAKAEDLPVIEPISNNQHSSMILKSTVKVQPVDNLEIFSMVTMTMNERHYQKE